VTVKSHMSSTSSPAQRLGPIALIEGVSRGNALAFLYTAFIGITLNTFVNFIQPYVLTEHLGVPESDQGRISGDLVFYAEMVLLFGCGLAGVAADRYGRRVVFMCGFLILGIGFALYGFVANYSALFWLRLFFAGGIACINVMVSTVQADYPRESSRGKLVGITGLMIGLGAMFLVFVLAPLPSRFAQEVNAVWAGRYTLLTVAAIALFSAVVARWGLAPLRGGAGDNQPGWRQALHYSFAAARTNPRVALAYGCAFVARGDLIVIGVFFSLWMTQAGIAQGLSSADAVKQAGLFFGLIQGTALLWAPIAGAINDRLDRVTATAAGLAVAALGYGSVGIIDDPLGPEMYLCAVLLGIGQMSVMLASQTLIGQEAPAQQRGAVMGAFSICGALGILFITKLGGAAFDSWKPAPFVMVAVCNVVLCLVALRVRKG
jgi:MFS family permease